MRIGRLNNFKRNIEITPVINHEKYPTERKKLRSLLNDDIWEMLSLSGAYIAGGAITSLFTNSDINDLDIYFPSMQSVVEAVACCYNAEEFVSEEGWAEVGSFTMHCMGSTDKSILFNYNGQDVQFMHFKYFNSPEAIFDTFDFTCCMAAYDVKNDRFVLHKDFLKHNSQRYLKYNPKTAFPLISALRVEKYKDKGYTISRPEMLRVSLSCNQLEINDWGEAAKQCGGMYGFPIEELFDTSKEFSIEELMIQLSGMESNIHEFKTNSPTFEELLLLIDSEFITNDFVFNPRCYYKNTEEDYGSPFRSLNDRIVYNLGKVVNGGRKGVYAWLDPKQGCHGDCCVELTPLGDNPTVISSYSCAGQVQIMGDLKVTKHFSREDPYKGLLDKWRVEV
jgi:hypothetical protein